MREGGKERERKKGRIGWKEWSRSRGRFKVANESQMTKIPFLLLPFWLIFFHLCINISQTMTTVQDDVDLEVAVCSSRSRAEG